MTPAPVRAGVAISSYYFAFLGALGAFLPYFPLVLDSAGFRPFEITALAALTPVSALAAPPLAGLVADALGRRVWILRFLTVATLAAFLGLFAAGGSHATIWLTCALFAFLRAPIWSLVDAAAFDHAVTTGGSYGRLRVWGSVGFLAAVAGGGLAAERVGGRAVLVATAAGLVLAAGCAFGIPAPAARRELKVLSAWRQLVGSTATRTFLVVIAFAQAASAAYDACYSLHLRRLGFGPAFTGVAWAVGVAAEIALLSLSGRLLARVPAPRLLALALAVAVVRWLVVAYVTSAAAILALQPLHGITFGLYYVCAVTCMRELAPSGVETAAQGLFAAAVGVGSLVGMIGAGAILERAGGRALFVAASVVVAVGAAVAARFVRLVAERPGGQGARLTA